MIDDYIQLDDELTIHYQQAGHGDTAILLVPGWTMSSRVFERQFEYFEASNQFRFISFDPRAHGLSSQTAGGHHYQQHGCDLNAFIDALQLDQFILGGWSFGCLATLDYLDQFGDARLSGFIMLDGPPRVAAEDNRKDWATYRYDDADGQQQFYTLGRLQDPEANNRIFANWMFEDKSEANTQWVLEITQQTPDNVAVLLNASSSFLDYRKNLCALEGRIPLCYLVRADQGEIVTRWARENTPSAQVAAFGEHLMFWERADQFNHLLTEFARRCCR